MHAAGARLVGCIAADEGAGVAWVALLCSAAGGWVLDCAQWQVLWDREDASSVRGATAIIVLVVFRSLVDGACTGVFRRDTPGHRGAGSGGRRIDAACRGGFDGAENLLSLRYRV